MDGMWLYPVAAPEVVNQSRQFEKHPKFGIRRGADYQKIRNNRATATEPLRDLVSKVL
jgi:hypothetical protein